MKYMYELIMWTKWTKDRDGEQEVCPYQAKSGASTARAASRQTSSRRICISYTEFILLIHIIHSYTVDAIHTIAHNRQCNMFMR